MKRLLTAVLVAISTTALAHASPLGLCTARGGEAIFARPGGHVRAALDNDQQVRIDNIYGRRWVFINAIIGEPGPDAPVVSGWVLRDDLNCTGGDNFQPPYRMPPMNEQTGGNPKAR